MHGMLLHPRPTITEADVATLHGLPSPSASPPPSAPSAESSRTNAFFSAPSLTNSFFGSSDLPVPPPPPSQSNGRKHTAREIWLAKKRRDRGEDLDIDLDISVPVPIRRDFVDVDELLTSSPTSAVSASPLVQLREEPEPTPKTSSFVPTYINTDTPPPPSSSISSPAVYSASSHDDDALHEGYTISDSDTSLALLRPLGSGAFSTVWLAHDTSSTPLARQARKSVRDLRRRKSSLWGYPGHTTGSGSTIGATGALTPEAREVVENAGLGVEVSERLELEGLVRRRSSKRKNVPGQQQLTLGMNRDAVAGIRPADTLSPSASGEGYAEGAALSRASSISSTGSSVRRDSSFRNGHGMGGEQRRLVAVKLVHRGRLEGSARTPIDDQERKERERERDRTRVSFVREVEILKNISHPNISSLLAHLSTHPAWHVLVLPYVPGGDLFSVFFPSPSSLSSSPLTTGGQGGPGVAWTKLRESVLRRLFAELVRGVGWMHSVGLVHRDIKLENILLTSTAFRDLTEESEPPGLEDVYASALHAGSHSRNTSAASRGHSRNPSTSTSAGAGLRNGNGNVVAGLPTPTHSRTPSETISGLPLSPPTSSTPSLSPSTPTPTSSTPTPRHHQHPPHPPLLKLTDFGLARFISPSRPRLKTKCGSETYAAPELVMASSLSSSHTNGEEGEEGGEQGGGYDPRKTDSWACGVCLYEMAVGRLPFAEDESDLEGAGGQGYGTTRRGQGQEEEERERRRMLVRIALGRWGWPSHSSSSPSVSISEGQEEEGKELVGKELSKSEGLRRVVEKLLVRDARRRVRVGELLDGSASGSASGGDETGTEGSNGEGGKDEWVCGAFSTASGRVMERVYVRRAGDTDAVAVGGTEVNGQGQGDAEREGESGEEEDGEEEEEGWVVQVPPRDSIARQELV